MTRARPMRSHPLCLVPLLALGGGRVRYGGDGLGLVMTWLCGRDAWPAITRLALFAECLHGEEHETV